MFDHELIITDFPCDNTVNNLNNSFVKANNVKYDRKCVFYASRCMKVEKEVYF